MRRIPPHVAARNRAASEADANAAYYGPEGRGQYLLNLRDGQPPILIDLPEFIRENLDLMPADRRRIRELTPGQAVALPGGSSLYCIEKGSL